MFYLFPLFSVLKINEMVFTNSVLKQDMTEVLCLAKLLRKDLSITLELRAERCPKIIHVRSE